MTVTLTPIKFAGSFLVPGAAGLPKTRAVFTAPQPDTTPPLLVSALPADDATGVNASVQPRLTFSEPIAFGTGNITLKTVGGSNIQVFNVATQVGSGPGQVEISGADLIMHPTDPISDGTAVCWRVDSTAIVDQATVPNAFAGIADDTTVNFTTAAAGTQASTSNVTTFTPNAAADNVAWSIGGGTMKRGTYALGETFLISDVARTLTAMGTASAQISGYWQYGAVVNPYQTVTTIGSTNYTNQGFNQKLIDVTGGSKKFLYASAMNVDPSAHSNGAFSISVGYEGTILKAITNPGTALNGWRHFEHYIPVTIVPTAKWPNAGDFRPSYSATDKTPICNLADIDLGCCRSLNLSSYSSLPTYNTVIAKWRSCIAHFGMGADNLRVVQVLHDASNTGYSADIGRNLLAQTGILMHSAALTTVQKTEFAKYIIQCAIDVCGSYDRGWRGGVGSGQHEFYVWLMCWAAALTDKAYFRTRWNGSGCSIGQMEWCQSAQVGYATAWPYTNEGGNLQYVQPYPNEDLGKGVWLVEGAPFDSGDGSQLDRTYLNVSGRARLGQLIGLYLLLANRSMPAGPELVSTSATFDTGVSRTAALAFFDREINVWPRDFTGALIVHSNVARDLRSQFAPAIQAHVPDTIPYALDGTVGFTAPTANQINWNFSAIITNNAFSSTPITSQHLYLSQDNIQFVETEDVAASGTVAVPGGINYWTGFALENAQGKGHRTPNCKKYQSSAAEIGRLSVTGTPTGSVTCTVLPLLHQREFPANVNMPWYVPCATSGTVPLGTILYFGTGFWTGAISGSPTVVLQRETSVGSGTYSNTAEVSPYTTGAIDAGKKLRLTVTRNSVSATGTAITMGT